MVPRDPLFVSMEERRDVTCPITDKVFVLYRSRIVHVDSRLIGWSVKCILETEWVGSVGPLDTDQLRAPAVCRGALENNLR